MSFHVPDVSGYVITGPPLVYQNLQEYNRQEFGPETELLKLLNHCTKGSKMNVWENLFIQEHHIRGTLILEQQFGEYNPLYSLANLTNLTPCSTLADSDRQAADRL